MLFAIFSYSSPDCELMHLVTKISYRQLSVEGAPIYAKDKFSVPNDFPSATYHPGRFTFLLTRSNRNQFGRALGRFVKHHRYVSAFILENNVYVGKVKWKLKPPLTLCAIYPSHVSTTYSYHQLTN